MKIARTLYIYLTCAVSLQGVAWAVITLLQDILPPGQIALETGVAFQIAVILIGLPVFVVHWLWAQRLAREDAEERGSILRRLYLYGIMAAFLGPALHSSLDLLITLVRLLFGISASPSSRGRGQLSDPAQVIVDRLIMLVVFALFWGYHWWIAQQDDEETSESHGAAVVRRLYLFGFCAAGLTLSTVGLIQLLRWIIYQFTGRMSLAQEIVVSHEVPRLVLGTAAWLLFWTWAQRLADRDEEEQRSILRQLYLYLVVFVGVIGVVSSAAFLLRALLLWLLRVPQAIETGELRTPLSTLAGMGLLWSYHAYVLRQQTNAAGGAPRQHRIRRIYLYLVAAVGFGALLQGIAGDVSVLIRASEGGLVTGLREQLAWATAVLIAGFVVWIVPWRQVQARAAAQDETAMAARRSIVRRVYLYFYLFVATMAGLSSAVYVVYRLISRLLGVGPRGNLLVDIGQSIAFLLLAVGVWLYHGYLLRGDQELIEEDRRRRLEGTQVAVVDLQQGEMGRAVLEGLQRELPGVLLEPVGLTEAAATTMAAATDAAATSAAADPDALVERLSRADLIVGPWVMAVAGGAEGTVGPRVAQAIVESPARKVLVPTQVEGWEWAGVERWKPDEIVQQAVRTVNQIAWKEELQPARRLSGGAIVAIIAGVVLLLLLLVVPLSVYFSI